MKNKIFILCSVFVVALIAKFLYNTTYTDFTLTSPEGVRQISIPHSGKFDSTRTNEFTVDGYISAGRLSSTVFHIIPDDEVLAITINDQPVDLSQIPASQLSSWNKGFKIDLKKYFTLENNHVRIALLDTGGQYAIQISNAISGIAQVPYWLILSLCVIIGTYTLSRSAGLAKELSAAITIGVLLRWFYVLITGFDARGHDTWEHIDYIMHFTKEWALPNLAEAKDGAYFHPPLYYWFSSIIFEISQFISPDNKEYGYKWLQYASFIYSIGFLIYAAKLIDFFFQEIQAKNTNSESSDEAQRIFSIASPRLYGLFATLSLSVWPSAVLHSCRIGNDPLLYFLLIAASYYIYRFYRTPTIHLFLLGAALTALAVVTKANAAVLGLAGIGIVIYHWTKIGFTFPKRAIISGIGPSILLIGAAILTFYPGVALKLKGERTHIYIDNINNVSQGLQVGNEAKNYLWLDVNTFINEPFTSPWEDKLGRQYFANYLGKTSLFGEWRFEGELARNSAMIISFTFLIMMMISAYSVYAINIRHLEIALPIVILHLLLVAPLYYMRMTFPVNIDFRYIIPSLATLVIIFNYGLLTTACSHNKRFAKLGLIVQSIFILSSISFVLHFAFNYTRGV